MNSAWQLEWYLASMATMLLVESSVTSLVWECEDTFLDPVAKFWNTLSSATENIIDTLATLADLLDSFIPNLELDLCNFKYVVQKPSTNLCLCMTEQVSVVVHQGYQSQSLFLHLYPRFYPLTLQLAGLCSLRMSVWLNIQCTQFKGKSRSLVSSAGSTNRHHSVMLIPIYI